MFKFHSQSTPDKIIERLFSFLASDHIYNGMVWWYVYMFPACLYYNYGIPYHSALYLPEHHTKEFMGFYITGRNSPWQLSTPKPQSSLRCMHLLGFLWFLIAAPNRVINELWLQNSSRCTVSRIFGSRYIAPVVWQDDFIANICFSLSRLCSAAKERENIVVWSKVVVIGFTAWSGLKFTWKAW